MKIDVKSPVILVISTVLPDEALGHADPDAIKHYARVDIENLRSYAIDVPTPSGNFEEL